MSYNILTSDRDDFVPFFAIAADKAGAYLIIDDQAVGWGVARCMVVVVFDERVVWGGVEGLEVGEGGLHLSIRTHLRKRRNWDCTLDSQTLAVLLDALDLVENLCG